MSVYSFVENSLFYKLGEIQMEMYTFNKDIAEIKCLVEI